MAEITTKGKNAPSVDMTPMVDLGFLLITFFMLATSFMEPKVIKITSPADGEVIDVPALKCSKSLTLVLDETDKVKYYICPESGQPSEVTYSTEGLRKLLIDRQKEVKTQWGNENELIVMLKSTPKAQYKKLIDAIDEMNITHSTFIMSQLDKQDSTVLKL